MTGDERGRNMQNNTNTQRSSGGLYEKLTISKATADRMVLISCALLIAVLFFGIRHGGFTVRFDTDGGSAVESQRVFHSETVLLPEEPYKEGYTFTGWYRDREHKQPWIADSDVVTESIVLYAGWKKNG